MRFLPLILLLTACASTVYNKPGAGQAQLDKDTAYCRYKLETVGDGIPWPHLLEGCLIHEKGWSKG